jgi:transcriptional regulator with XRE-family HTH domain
VVEIGNALRAVRERRGLELAEVERETRIRERYLAALEEERFELLPARAYAKGFLRVYADYLGLDGRLIVEEFNARFPEAEQPELAPPPAKATLARAGGRRLSGLLVAVLAVALFGVLAWRFAAVQHRPAFPASPSTRTRSSQTIAAPTPGPPGHAAARPAHLVLRARGPCWLSIRAGSAAGPVLYEATLEAGGILRYTLAPGRPRLWLRIGAPWNLELSLNGKPATALPPGPGNVLVNRSGLRSA